MGWRTPQGKPFADVAQLVEQLPCKGGQRSRLSQKPSVYKGKFFPSLVTETVYVRPLWGAERAQERTQVGGTSILAPTLPTTHDSLGG